MEVVFPAPFIPIIRITKGSLLFFMVSGILTGLRIDNIISLMLYLSSSVAPEFFFLFSFNRLIIFSVVRTPISAMMSSDSISSKVVLSILFVFKRLTKLFFTTSFFPFKALVSLEKKFLGLFSMSLAFFSIIIISLLDKKNKNENDYKKLIKQSYLGK